ncbi:MAG: SRPBCC family protein [Acidimicrobiales bacterium]
MDVSADLDAPCPAEELYAWVGDLGRYPSWLDIVARAEPTGVAASDPGPAWSIDLRGRLGPLARSKRLRMVRTVDQAPFTAMFERREDDGRSHAAWVLRAEIAVTADGSRLTMHMHYGGALWGPVIERLLGDEIGQSRTRLLACITGPGHPS